MIKLGISNIVALKYTRTKKQIRNLVDFNKSRQLLLLFEFQANQTINRFNFWCTLHKSIMHLHYFKQTQIFKERNIYT